MNDTAQLLNLDEAAARLGITKAALKRLCIDGEGPRFAQLSRGDYRFKTGDVDTWLEGQFDVKPKYVAKPRKAAKAKAKPAAKKQKDLLAA